MALNLTEVEIALPRMFMGYFDLTLPLDHEWMPDQVFPIDTRFFLGPRTHPDKGIIIGSGTGTCITLPAQFAEFRRTRRLHEVPVDELFLRSVTVLDLPKDARQEITEQEVQASLKQAKPVTGDALLIRTGWGDTGVHKQPGTNYIMASPHLSLKAAELLAAKMKETKSNLLLSDVAVIGLPGKHLIPEWCSLQPLPPPWPSPESRVYLHLYTAEKAQADFAVDLVLAKAEIMTVKKLINCGALERKKTRIIVSPLHIVRGVASTCRVIAIEE